MQDLLFDTSVKYQLVCAIIKNMEKPL